MKLFLTTSFTFSLLFYLSCHCDDDTSGTGQLQDFLNCDPSVYEVTGFSYCSERQLDSSLYCDIVFVGSTMLQASAKGDLRYMCGEIKQVVFEDSLGATVVYEKDSGARISGFSSSSQACDSSSTQTIFRCEEREVVWASLKSDAQDMNFLVEIQARNGAQYEPYIDFDLLTVWRGGLQPEPSSRHNVLSYRIYEDNTRGESLHYDFAETLVLNGQVYDSVFYAQPGQFPVVDMEIYFTKELGIIAYRDMDGKAWYFKEFR